MTSRVAFVGTGARGAAHADAYRLLDGAHFVGCYDPDRERANRFTSTFDTPVFDDLNAMLETAKPDLVHITTPPAVRYDVMRAVSDAGIAGCTVEKPVAIGVVDWTALSDLAETTGTKFGVCHQLRWCPPLVKCRDAIVSGELGQILFIDTSARMTIADQGTHALHYAGYLNGDSPVRSVFGAASGWTPDPRHPGPENAIASVVFENGTRCQWNIGPTAPVAGDPHTIWQHVRVAAYAEHGSVLWEEFGKWRIDTHHGVIEGRVDLGEWERNNRIAQANFHAGMLEWISGGAPVGTRLEHSLMEWKAVLALYASTLTCVPIELATFTPPDDLDDRLREMLA